MPVQLGEQALLDDAFVPTGDRITDLILSVYAGTPLPDYNNEIQPTSTSRAWCHAILSGTDLPALSVDGVEGYRLTHRIFYSTDFGRVVIEDSNAVDVVMAELSKSLLSEELILELGICLLALGQPCPQYIIDIAAIHANHSDNHTDVVARLLLKRL